MVKLIPPFSKNSDWIDSIKLDCKIVNQKNRKNKWPRIQNKSQKNEENNKENEEEHDEENNEENKKENKDEGNLF